MAKATVPHKGTPDTIAGKTTSLEGTQAIRRAVSMLKIIASGTYPGVTLADVAERMELSRSTTHRILRALVNEGLVEQDPIHNNYTIGRLAFELSLASTRDFHGAAGWNRVVESVARRTNHTTYLLARSGVDAVIIQKAEGRASLRVVPVDVGQRRALGVGAGALALLASFDPTEIERVIATIAPGLHHFANLTPELLLQDALAARARGYAISRGRVFSEVVGLGFSLPTPGVGQLAISIAMPASVVDDAGLVELARIMKQEIATGAPAAKARA
jgi:DNA-binding IclR family transcriptional regulator